MTEESVSTNSRKCVTLRLDPCRLELGRESIEIHLRFGAIFEFLTGNRKKRI